MHSNHGNTDMSVKRRPCEKCGSELPRHAPIKPRTDGLGNYWMAAVCPSCDATLTYFYPGEDNELRPELRNRTERDPDPPSPAEMPDYMTSE